MKHLVLLTLGALCLVGCGGPGAGTPSTYTDEEKKAMQQAASLTPQQQLERAEANTTLPPDQKAALIRSIKEKNNLP